MRKDSQCIAIARLYQKRMFVSRTTQFINTCLKIITISLAHVVEVLATRSQVHLANLNNPEIHKTQSYPHNSDPSSCQVSIISIFSVLQ